MDMVLYRPMNLRDLMLVVIELAMRRWKEMEGVLSDLEALA
jgi:hypothetical protein